jgi:UDP-N-acetylglucosamine---dolichyl-phosphate N-acetylglucosaminyltransferase
MKIINMKIFVVMPAYNEEKKIGSVIKDLRNHGYTDIIVVDDGSRDNTRKISISRGAIVVKHVINMGYGGALMTGMEYAFRNGADIAVSFDADGQHDVNDIKRVVKPILDKKSELVIGIRMLNKKEMPFIRRVGNFGLTFLTFLLFGVWTQDSQSGFRAVSKNAWSKMNLKSSGFEYSSEMMKEIACHNIKFAEVPIRVIYSDYSLSKSHGQSVIGGFKTFLGMLKRRILN